MAEGYKGRSFLLKVGNGATMEAFTAIGGIQTKSLSINNNPVDVSDDSAGYQKMLPDGGIQSMEISGSGIVKNNAQAKALIAAADARSEANYQLVSGLGDTYEGTFVIASFQRTGNHDGAETFSITLQSSGEIDYTAPV